MFFRYQFWIAQMTDRVGCVCLRQGETLNPAPFCLLDYFGAQQSASLPLSDLWSVSLSPLRNRFGDYVSVSCSWISARAEKPNLKSISRRSTVGTDGGTVGVTRPAGMPMAASVDIFNCGGNNSEGGGCLFSTACDCFALFCMDPTFKHVFVYNAENSGDLCWPDFLFFSPPSLCIYFCTQVCHHPDCQDLNSKGPLHLCESCDSRCHSENSDNMHFDRHPRFDLQPQGRLSFLSVFGILSSDDDVIPTASFTVLMSRTFHFFFSVLS